VHVLLAAAGEVAQLALVEPAGSQDDGAQVPLERLDGDLGDVVRLGLRPSLGDADSVCAWGAAVAAPASTRVNPSVATRLGAAAASSARSGRARAGATLLSRPSSQRTRYRGGCSRSTSSTTPMCAGWPTRSDSRTMLSPT
jgi:hypothetical protein